LNNKGNKKRAAFSDVPRKTNNEKTLNGERLSTKCCEN